MDGWDDGGREGRMHEWIGGWIQQQVTSHKEISVVYYTEKDGFPLHGLFFTKNTPHRGHRHRGRAVSIQSPSCWASPALYSLISTALTKDSWLSD